MTLRSVRKAEDVDRDEYKQRQVEDPYGSNEYRLTVAISRIFHGACVRPVHAVHDEEDKPSHEEENTSNPLKKLG